MRLELVQALKPVDSAFLGREGDMYEIVKEVSPDIIVLGYDQVFDEKKLEAELAKRGLKAKVVRLSKYGEDLNGTRKIIKKIIDWYTVNKGSTEGNGK
jgi:FAD synthetase